jgi:hypothetical protein
MLIKVVRKKFTENSTIGELYLDDKFFCYTLEDCEREIPGKDVSQWKVYGKTAIPRGRYLLKVSMSPKYKRELPELLDVPGYKGVRIHSGNTPLDTEGCILVGDVLDVDRVASSRVAFDRLFIEIKAARARRETMFIEITGSKPL